MKAWDAYLDTLTKILTPEAVTRWLRPLRVQRFDAANLYLIADNALQVSWFNEHIRPRLKQGFTTPSGRPIKVHLNFHPKPQSEPSEIASSPNYCQDSIDKTKTLDNYLGNPLATQVLREMAYNPVYIYGPHGSGKTHLLMACAKDGFYVHAETFTEHVVDAMRRSDMERFRAAYRNVKMLIIDDLHLLKGRGATQEELFHTFNVLHAANIPIILSSYLPACELKAVAPRLISRFEWGITLRLNSPSPEVLEKTLSKFPHTLEPDAAQFLRETFQAPSALCKALDALTLRAHLNKITHFSLAQTQMLLSDLIQAQEKKNLQPADILKAVAENFKIQTEDILGKSQTKRCSLPRKISMFLMRHKLKMAYAKIGETFSRDHSTVLTSCQDIEKQIQNYASLLRQITQQLK